MLVQGCECSIVVKTACREIGVPYSAETVREAVSLLREEAAIEGDGVCRAVVKGTGVAGCVVTPLTMGSAPLLLALALGSAGGPVFVSGAKDLFSYDLRLLPLEEGIRFDLAQDRGGARRVFEGCVAEGFELRVLRGTAVQLRLDLRGDCPPFTVPVSPFPDTPRGERFQGDDVVYRVNGTEYRNIYGLTIAAKKAGGTLTDVWIKRGLEKGPDLPGIIEELSLTARLVRTGYEAGRSGVFRLTVKRLVLVSDETEVEAPNAVIGPLRYYAAGPMSGEVFAPGGGPLE